MQVQLCHTRPVPSLPALDAPAFIVPDAALATKLAVHSAVQQARVRGSHGKNDGQSGSQGGRQEEFVSGGWPSAGPCKLMQAALTQLKSYSHQSFLGRTASKSAPHR